MNLLFYIASYKRFCSNASKQKLLKVNFFKLEPSTLLNYGWKGEHTIWKAFRSFPHVPFTKDSGWVTDIRVHDGPRTPNIGRISIEAFIFPIWNSSSVLLSRLFFTVSQTCYILVWPAHAVREGMETIHGTSRTAVVWSSWAYTYSSDRAWRSLKFMTCQKKVYICILWVRSQVDQFFLFLSPRLILNRRGCSDFFDTSYWLVA